MNELFLNKISFLTKEVEKFKVTLNGNNIETGFQLNSLNKLFFEIDSIKNIYENKIKEILKEKEIKFPLSSIYLNFKLTINDFDNKEFVSLPVIRNITLDKILSVFPKEAENLKDYIIVYLEDYIYRIYFLNTDLGFKCLDLALDISNKKLSFLSEITRQFYNYFVLSQNKDIDFTGFLKEGIFVKYLEQQLKQDFKLKSYSVNKKVLIDIENNEYNISKNLIFTDDLKKLQAFYIYLENYNNEHN